MRYTATGPASQHPVWMSPEETADPKGFIEDFCRSWDLTDCRFYLWRMLSGSLSCGSYPVDASAGSQLYFFENLVAMIEAVYQLRQVQPAGEPGSPAEERAEVNNSQVENDSTLIESQPEVQAGIDAFFSAYSLKEFTERLFFILEAYSANDYYKKSSPSDVLYAMEKLSDLIRVAHDIYQELNKRGKGLEFSREPGHEQIALFGDLQARNPSEVITAFFEARTLEEWERCLKHITFFALSTDDPDEGGCKEDTLHLYNTVCGLVEACWVVGSLPGAYVSC
jgi:hypothetical protein